jgi:hypothetical protein
MDNALGYTIENSVPCCKACNMTKKCLDAATFIKRCRHISGDEEDWTVWPDRMPSSYREYEYRANKKGFEFQLSEQEFDEICSAPCEYCDKELSDTHKNGVDRKDNSQGYTLTNATPCCTECNMMKDATHGDDYVDLCVRVSEHWHERELPEMSQCLYVITRNDNKKRKMALNP